MGRTGQAEPTRRGSAGAERGTRAARGQPGHPSVAARAGLGEEVGTGQTLAERRKIKVYLGLHPLLPPCPKCPGFARAQLFKERVGVPVGATSSAADAQEVHSPIFCCFCFTGGPWPPTPPPKLLLWSRRNPKERVKQPVDALPMHLPPGVALLTTGKH